MAEESDTLTYEQSFAVGPADLYRAFTSSTALREWLCDTATTSPRPNGHLFVGWNDGYYATGHFTELLTNRAVCFTWQGRGEPRPSRVHVALEPSDQGTRLRLEHSGIGQGPEWGDKAAEFNRAWRRSLENLNSVLTSGEDLRVTRRPMLGVLLAAFDADDAARLGVPVAEGVRLSGVVPGLGAAAAGLTQDDVIVGVDDRPTPDVAALRGALQSRQVGDTVSVAIYRGGARQELPMTLSGRAIPDIPADAAELLARVAARYARDEAALDAALDGVSELEASLRPGPEEWNVKQVMAHLIQGERYNQQWISELLGDLEASYDSDAANQEVRLNATIHAFPTLADMVAEWRRLNAETLALIEALPEEFVRRRRTYWRLARTLLDESYSHVSDHLSQILTTVASARREVRS
jgi:uncharacterized protein YndB with AHSA1/START domain